MGVLIQKWISAFGGNGKKNVLNTMTLLPILYKLRKKQQHPQGVLRKRVVTSRETRMTSLLCHILMTAATIGALPALKALPVPVLHGVFLTMAYQGANGNPFVERILLWFTELSRYGQMCYHTLFG